MLTGWTLVFIGGLLSGAAIGAVTAHVYYKARRRHRERMAASIEQCRTLTKQADDRTRKTPRVGSDEVLAESRLALHHAAAMVARNA